MGTAAETVRTIVAAELELPLEQIDLDSELEGDLGVDSLAAVQIGYELEVALDIEMPEELINVRTVADLIAFVDERGVKVARS